MIDALDLAESRFGKCVIETLPMPASTNSRATWFPTKSPHLALGRDARLLAVFLDAIAAYGHYCIEVQGRVDTAILVEREEGEGWRGSHAEQRLAEWGVVDQHGVYLLAGLTKAEQEVAYLHFDRGLDSQEIGKLLHRPPVTVRVQLHRANERLRRLAA